jgi:uncharacterized protein (DUF608 family)
MSTSCYPAWPVIASYDLQHLRRIALPLGGIGTGTVSLGGRGDLRDWELLNKPGIGWFSQNKGAFFAIYVKAGDAPAITRALEGPIDVEDYEGSSGCLVPNHGLPRFSEASFHTAYPLVQILLTDPDVPVTVRLEAFNPFIPADADASGLPVAVLRYVLTNTTDATVTASICGTSPHFFEAGGEKTSMAMDGGGLRGVQLAISGGDRWAESWGTFAIITPEEDVTTRTAWVQMGWSGALLDFWDDFSEDGRLDARDGTPFASVAASVTIPSHGECAVTFLLAWHFPNRMSWTPTPAEEQPCCCAGDCAPHDVVGNYYTTQFADAWDAAVQAYPRLPALEETTVRFVRAVCDSPLPTVVKEAALANLSTLHSTTCFRTADGLFFGWEGCNDGAGCCHGSCTHVWNYEQATAFLFGDLSRAMRQVEFGPAMLDNGLMCFRVAQPISRATAWPVAAADGQMGCLMKLYRDWQLSGDDDFLRALWPNAKQALAFCWMAGGWDADQDGVMEGCQHNTMDVEYFGPNPQMGIWYLGALRCGALMARAMGDAGFADRCQTLYDRGRAWIDAHLFNGEFYEQQVWPPMSQDNIAPGLQANMGATNLEDPQFQIGPACLVDQLVGQFLAHVCDLGYLTDSAHIRTTLQSIYRYNFQSLDGHFNNMRSYAMTGETGVLMATYPRGHRPKWPFPYFNEVMTGFEYTAAVHMLYEGMLDEGLAIIAAIRARYDGRKRNPFNEAECGNHYARAMASWGAVLALTGFHYSAVTGTMTLAPLPGETFWSTGDAWGTYLVADGQVTVTVLFGTLPLCQVVLRGEGMLTLAIPVVLRSGEAFTGEMSLA